MTHLFVAVLVLSQASVQPAPAAMVVEVKGKVELQPAKGMAKALAVMDILYPEDQLRPNLRSQVMLIFLADGHHEQVLTKGPVTIGRNGCTPLDGIEKIKKLGPGKNSVLEGLKELSRSSRGSTIVARSPPVDQKPAVLPITGTSLLTDRPSFRWPTDAKAKSYLVELYTATGRLLWQATTSKPTLDYPVGKKPLAPNRQYTWHVLSDYEDERKPLAAGEFYFLTATKAVELKALELLAKSSNPADMLLAAMAYEGNRVYEEALRLYERLSELSPQEPAYLAARAALYEQAGRTQEAKKAWGEAEKLGFVRPAQDATKP